MHEIDCTWMRPHQWWACILSICDWEQWTINERSQGWMIWSSIRQNIEAAQWDVPSTCNLIGQLKRPCLENSIYHCVEAGKWAGYMLASAMFGQTLKWACPGRQSYTTVSVYQCSRVVHTVYITHILWGWSFLQDIPTRLPNHGLPSHDRCKWAACHSVVQPQPFNSL